jgi:hypothetical protein
VDQLIVRSDESEELAAEALERVEVAEGVGDGVKVLALASVP